MHSDVEKKRSDAELVKLACDGDDAAMATLISLAMPIARAKAAAQQAKNSRLSAEDLVQEGMLGFLNALRTYSESKGSSFRTYADVCIGNRIISAVRSNNNLKNYSLTSAIPIPDDDDCAQVSTDPQNIIIDNERFEDLKNFLNNGTQLSDFEKSVIECRISGFSYKQTAQKLGTGTKAVDNALARVRKKMRDNF